MSALLAANQFGSSGSSSAPSDVLYVTIGCIVFVLLIVAVAAALNKREDRRSSASSARHGAGDPALDPVDDRRVEDPASETAGS